MGVVPFVDPFVVDILRGLWRSELWRFEFWFWVVGESAFQDERREGGVEIMNN